jgi:hypothetical protein
MTHEDSSTGSRDVPCGQTDWWMNLHNETKSLSAILLARLKYLREQKYPQTPIYFVRLFWPSAPGLQLLVITRFMRYLLSS